MPKSKKSNARSVVEATLDKISELSRPAKKFIVHIVDLWLGMNCRYRFSNMSRWGSMSDKGYRNAFGRDFDWFQFNETLVKENCGKEIVAVFDPSYIKKSGKQTFGMGTYWSGVSQRALRGLEIGCLAFVDVAAHTAFHGLAVQTPSKEQLKKLGKNLVQHYADIITARVDSILSITRYLAVDGYFMKKEFIQPILSKGLHIITKGRADANLNYLFNGKQKPGRGRKKIYDGKIDISKIDKRRIKCYYNTDGVTIYAGLVYSVILKQVVMAAFVYYGNNQYPEIIICTDTHIEPKKMCEYYGLRFQVEFLIRDSKQHTGLEDCMARDEQKLNMHFNLSMSIVSIAKVAYHLSEPADERGSFSMADIKMYYMNKLITDRIFSNLEIDLSCRKIKRIYTQCLNFGRLRA